MTTRKPTPRQAALFGALGLSLLATAWVAREDSADTEAPAIAPRRMAKAAPGSGPATTDWPGAAPAARAAWPALDEQAREAWGEAPPAPSRAAPPPAVAEAPPPPPAAPPFPYQFVGLMTDGLPRAVLNNAQRSRVAGAGEVVDNRWRIDAVEPTGLRVTFLPLGQSQLIAFASAPS